jgi:hypothetical protein
VKFDSDEYVTDFLRTSYGIVNEQLDEVSEHVTKFSEGNVGSHGILVSDVDVSGGSAKFVAKRWTMAYADPAETYLQRVPMPDIVGYGDMAINSTAMRVRCALPLAEFFSLQPSTVWVWRGCAYLWTDASWSDGVLSMTLQRVSQPASGTQPTPPPPTPTLTGISASFSQGGAVIVGTDSLDTLKQYLTVKATYSDSTTRVLAANEYTLSGTLAYPSATVTAQYQGESDTFSVAVAYDAQVEYLQSTGTQYIDTGISPHQDIKLEIKWKNTSNQTSKWLFGSGTDNTDGIKAYIGNSNYWRFGGAYVTLSTSNTTTRTAVVDKTGINLNGTNHSYNVTVGTFSSSTSIKIFAGATGTAPISTRIYYLKIWDNGTLVRDFIPVRVGQVGYMYDRVSGHLFGNAGTGNFVVGADV